MLDVGRMAGITLTRIDAVDARAIEHQLDLATMIDSGPVGHIGIGTLACTLSHAEAWRTFLDDGAPWGVFREDDVVLSDDFKDTVERLVQAPLPVDLVKIECEVQTIAQLEAALAARADVILLDNMSPAELTDAVKRIHGRAIAEASGGITLDTVRAVAESGVNLISVGWITHSAPTLDVALDFDEPAASSPRGTID